MKQLVMVTALYAAWASADACAGEPIAGPSPVGLATSGAGLAVPADPGSQASELDDRAPWRGEGRRELALFVAAVESLDEPSKLLETMAGIELDLMARDSGEAAARHAAWLEDMHWGMSFALGLAAIDGDGRADAVEFCQRLAMARATLARRTGDKQAALDALEFVIELRPERFARSGGEGPTVETDGEVVKVALNEQVMAFLDDVYEGAALVEERGRLRREIASEREPLQQSILEAPFAEWHLGRFGPLDEELFQMTPKFARTPDPALDWAVPGSFAHVASYDMARLPMTVGASSIVFSLSALRADPGALVELDSLMADRWGMDWDTWIARALVDGSKVYSDVVPPLDPLAPLLERLLASEHLDGRNVLTDLVDQIFAASKEAPALAVAVGEAALLVDGDRAKALSRPWIDFESFARNADNRIPPISENSSLSLLVGVMIRHADAEVRLVAGKYVAARTRGAAPVLEWASSTSAAERAVALSSWKQRLYLWPDDLGLHSISREVFVETTAALARDPELVRDVVFELRPNSVGTGLFELVAGIVSDDELLARLVAVGAMPILDSVGGAESVAALNHMLERGGPSTRSAFIDLLARGVQGAPLEMQERVLTRAVDSGDPQELAALDRWLFEPSTLSGDLFFEVLKARAGDENAAFYATLGGIDTSFFGVVDALSTDDGRKRALRIAIDSGASRAIAATTQVIISRFAAGLRNGEDGSMAERVMSAFSVEERAAALLAMSEQDPQGTLRRVANVDGYDILNFVAALPDSALVAARLVGEERADPRVRVAAAAALDPSGPQTRDQMLDFVKYWASAPQYDPRDNLDRVVGGIDFEGRNEVLTRWLAPIVAGREALPTQRYYLYQWLQSGEAGAFTLGVMILEVERLRGESPRFPVSIVADALASEPERRAEAVVAVRALLGDAPRRSVLELAGELAWPEFAEDIARWTRIGSSRETALDALRRYTDSEIARAAIQDALLSDDEGCRERARNVLESWQLLSDIAVLDGRVPSRQKAVGDLFELLDSEDPAVRAEAARGLGTIGAVEALPRLIALLSDDNALVRGAAREALDTLNAKANAE